MKRFGIFCEIFVFWIRNLPSQNNRYFANGIAKDKSQLNNKFGTGQ